MRKAAVVFITLIAAAFAAGRTITVDDDNPADFDNIQAAIEDANDGDTVEIQPGRYTGPGNRDIDFLGKAITVTSIDPNDPNTVAETIIDCNSLGRGFHFHNDEDANSVLAGLTITNGYADIGGGILCDDASPSVIDCVITLNVAYEDFGVVGYGGGIYCIDSNALITGCMLTDNEARPFDSEILVAGLGSGIYSHRGRPVISNCVFDEDKSINGGPTGTIHCLDGRPTITGCTVSNHRNSGQSGIYLSYCEPVIRNSIVSGCGYAGITFDDVTDGTISGCTIRDNLFSGISSQASNLTFSRCLIVENLYTGIECIMSQSEIRNCSIARNGNSRSPVAVVCEGEGTCTIIGSILWGSRDDCLPIRCGHPHSDCDNVVIDHSCVENWDGTLGGVGNIGEDPMFADPNEGDYHLKSQGGRWDVNEGRWMIDDVTSSCIDAGDPTMPIGFEPFPNGGIINMGAYGGTTEASKSYFGGPACETIVAGDINGDCEINFLDFRLMALHWMDDHD